MCPRSYPIGDHEPTPSASPPWLAGSVHHLTRSTIAASVLILAAGVAFAMQPRTPPPPSAPPPAAPAAQPAGQLTEREDPSLTQRRGEWSPLCAMTQNPLVDFSPVDRGNGRHRILLTVHNCSAEPVTLDEAPFLWFGGREMMAEYLRPDPELTDLAPITLAPRESAQAVLSWESFGAPAALEGEGQAGGTLSLRMPKIGEGQVEDPALHDLTPAARAWLSGWTR